MYVHLKAVRNKITHHHNISMLHMGAYNILHDMMYTGYRQFRKGVCDTRSSLLHTLF